jgi:lycopene beta-cyclase
MTSRATVDTPPRIVLVGAGLASALIAQRISSESPAVAILMLEASAVPFGEHTWSFHDTDVTPTDQRWLAPLVAHRWSGQSVRFKAFDRHLTSGYACLTSASVGAAMARLKNLTLRANAPAKEVLAGHVTLADGSRIEASCVIDARGFSPSPALVLGHQKFLGLEVETAEPHGIEHPVIMDASVDQQDGYRFVYLLPFSSHRILIEDTRYSDNEGLDRTRLVNGIMAYARGRGWSVAKVLREEQGVLPIALAHDAQRFWNESPRDVPQAGMRAALFHPTTGYSLPDAVRVANLVAGAWPMGSRKLAAAIRSHAMRLHRRQGFYRMLNRFLFQATSPARRHLVMQRFYTLPQPLIERFYAGRPRIDDIARILIGKPPIPIHHALAVIREAPLLSPKAPRS